MARQATDIETYISGIRAGDRLLLSRGLTLVESKHPGDRRMAEHLLKALLPYSGKSIRIGITGVPGAGKSTFIEAFGTYLTGKGLKVAVLAVDPSSQLSGGSILGDKTRMENLSRNPGAFIRPTPSGTEKGGIASGTAESIILCEAAGYEVILVETVGVGQAETMVKDITDLFLLLMLTGAGDDLQGIKRGIMEIADAVIVHKADGDNLENARITAKQLEQVLHMFPAAESGWTVPVLTCSSLNGSGLQEVAGLVERYKELASANGFLDKNREKQELLLFRKKLEALIRDSMETKEDFIRRVTEAEQKIRNREISAGEAAVSVFRAIQRQDQSR